jgi:hypothetical protein
MIKYLFLSVSKGYFGATNYKLSFNENMNNQVPQFRVSKPG